MNNNKCWFWFSSFFCWCCLVGSAMFAKNEVSLFVSHLIYSSITVALVKSCFSPRSIYSCQSVVIVVKISDQNFVMNWRSRCLAWVFFKNSLGNINRNLLWDIIYIYIWLMSQKPLTKACYSIQLSSYLRYCCWFPFFLNF